MHGTLWEQIKAPSNIIIKKHFEGALKATAAQGNLAPEMPKRAPQSHNPPKCAYSIDLEFNVGLKQIKECYFHASKFEK